MAERKPILGRVLQVAHGAARNTCTTYVCNGNACTRATVPNTGKGQAGSKGGVSAPIGKPVQIPLPPKGTNPVLVPPGTAAPITTGKPVQAAPSEPSHPVILEKGSGGGEGKH